MIGESAFFVIIAFSSRIRSQCIFLFFSPSNKIHIDNGILWITRRCCKLDLATASMQDLAPADEEKCPEIMRSKGAIMQSSVSI